MNQEDKQQARKKRELKMRRWLTTLTWTLPVFSFGSFFAVWNDVAHAATHASSTAKTMTVNSTKSNSSSNTNANTTTNSGKSTKISKAQTALFKIGSRSVQVSHIQEQLAELGLFHHALTNYYGPVTADAVKQFQKQHQLPATGSMDQKTLTALQKAVKHVRTHKLTSSSHAKRTYHHSEQHASSSYHAPTHSRVGSSSSSNSGGTSGSSSASSQTSPPPVSQSQQTAPPVTSSSAS